ncbi:lasso peptide biosynthesis PqqD family chaperone [Nocardia mexicana]|uniref:Coenzyme PQQ synthesis protein D (PqqD) n=1 Tax=Nocardia mexicana TaxID=279262 RepID=A0A370HD85_9NOCA|nr:lasso peptide biosynthesis PqqD family chaperone [Nocardia mexicana]RDI52823.1 coenzyme PQQ synthesis protein D (PqqD) [Nocardia mexicana]
MHRLRDDVSVCPTEDGTILLDERHGRYWQLNTTGAEILDAFLAGATADEMVRTLVDTRPVDRRRAAADVADLLTQLTRADLVRSV